MQIIPLHPQLLCKPTYIYVHAHIHVHTAYTYMYTPFIHGRVCCIMDRTCTLDRCAWQKSPCALLTSAPVLHLFYTCTAAATASNKEESIKWRRPTTMLPACDLRSLFSIGRPLFPHLFGTAHCGRICSFSQIGQESPESDRAGSNSFGPAFEAHDDCPVSERN